MNSKKNRQKQHGPAASSPIPEEAAIFATMEDLTPYLGADTSWIAACAARMGWDELAGYYERVLGRLQAMRPGEDLHVDREVRPQNRPLFLRCACLAIDELLRLTPWDVYYIERQGYLIQKR